MTYPLIGNYGVNAEDAESERLWLSGLIVKEYSDFPSNWRSEEALDVLLKREGTVAIDQIDTRTLTRKIREKGAMQAILSTETEDLDLLLEKVRQVPPLKGQDLVSQVTCTKAYQWESGGGMPTRFRVVVYDFGVKRNILRMLRVLDCEVIVVPAATPAAELLAMEPDGVLLSNGPGDPEALPYAMANAKALLGKVPLFGICLGHQILSLALGGKSFKMKFGHHGGNQPVMDLATKKVQITAQNHGFAVDFSAIEKEVEITHINLNDQTVEGMRHRRLPVSSVQYHPEAAPGPHDAQFFFQNFVDSFSK